jgi:DNA/RNA endonuclease G (NUC1)
MREKLNDVILIIIIGLVFSLLINKCYAQNDTLVDRGIYRVKYSQKLKQPKKLIYSVYHYTSNFERGSQDFYQEKGIITSSSKDYKSNQWDKGHLAPAETFSNTKQNLYKTFSYLNCALQHEELNRGLWKKLESTERKLSQSYSIVVIIELDFNWSDGNIRKTDSGAVIPFYFKKSIYLTKSNRLMQFVFPNMDCGNGIEKYKTFDGAPKKEILKLLFKL